MGYYYGYGGLLVPDGEDRLRVDWLNAEERLRAFRKALNAPVGSFEWEDAVHSGETIEKKKKSARQAKEEYFKARNARQAKEQEYFRNMGRKNCEK